MKDKTCSFTKKDISTIGKVLGADGKKRGNNIRFEIAGDTPQRKLALEIYPDIPIGDRKGNLVTVYTQNTHLQLHFCSGFVVSAMLGEVTFVSDNGGKLSGLIVERGSGCSLYANVDRKILSGDFTQLGPEIMMSGIALSLTESILPEPSSPAQKRKARTRR
jgi:hypothetical protein